LAVVLHGGCAGCEGGGGDGQEGGGGEVHDDDDGGGGGSGSSGCWCGRVVCWALEIVVLVEKMLVDADDEMRRLRWTTSYLLYSTFLLVYELQVMCLRIMSCRIVMLACLM